MKCSMRSAMWPAIYLSSLSSVAAETLHSRGAGRSTSPLQRNSALQTELVHNLGSTPHDELVDPYAPKHAGSPTLTAYCEAGHNQDPACKADGKTEDLNEEIQAVKKHMRCMFHPETCPPGMDPTGKHGVHGEESQQASGTGTSSDTNVANGKSAGEGHANNGDGSSSENTASAHSGAGNAGAGSGNGGAGSGGVKNDHASNAGAGKDSTGTGGAGSGGAGNGGAGHGGAGNDNAGHAGSGGAGSGGAGGGAGSSGGSDGKANGGDAGNGSGGTGNTGGGNVGAGNGGASNGGAGKDGAGADKGGGSGGSNDAMCTDIEFKKRVTEHHGNSDESFKVTDTNRDRRVSRGEFQTLGTGVGCSESSTSKVFEDFKKGTRTGHDHEEEIVDEDIIYEEEYKDTLLATPQEVARRLRQKHDTPEEAFAAADSDHSNSLTEKEVGAHCTTVAKPDACRVVQESLGSSPSRQEYEDFIEYGHVPPAPTTAAPTAAPKTAPARKASVSKSTVAPTGAAQDKKVNSATRQMARTERQHVEDKIVEIAELKHELEKDEELDPELGRAMTGVIENGEVFSGALEDVGDGKVTDTDEALEEVETSADNVVVAAFDLETGVHPHGFKWWRYRWEYSLIEAIMLIFLILLVIIAHACIDKGRRITEVFMPTKMVGFSSMLNLHNITFSTCVKEFAVLGVLQGLIWIMNQFGFFDWMLTLIPQQVERTPMAMAQMHGAHSLVQVATGFHMSMHLPNTGADLVYTLRCVNMHLFLGIAFYFLVMYHVVVAAIYIFSMFLAAEDNTAYDKYLAAISVEDFIAGTPRGGGSEGAGRKTVMSPRSGLPKRRSTGIVDVDNTQATLRMTGGCLRETKDFHSVRRYFIHHVLMREDLCEYLIKEAGLADGKALDDTLHRIFFYRYLSVHIRKRLMEMITIDFRIWLGMVGVLVCDVVLHVYAHVSFVELLPVYITFAFSIQMWQIYHAHSQLKNIVSHGASDEEKDAEVSPTVEERHGTSFGQTHRLDLWTVRVQQLILLLICYSGARVIASPYLWTDYFKLSCFITATFFIIYLFHVFIGSIWITLDMIVYSLPPYINDDEKVALVETINEAKGYSERTGLVPF